MATPWIATLLVPDRLAGRVNKAKEVLSNVPFDMIIVRGLSGSLIAGPLALELNKPIGVVRKPHEQTHGTPIEIPDGRVGSWIIVDDLISSGKTVLACLEALEQYQPGAVQGFKGVYLHNSTEFLTPTEMLRGMDDYEAQRIRDLLTRFRMAFAGTEMNQDATPGEGW